MKKYSFSISKNMKRKFYFIFLLSFYCFQLTAQQLSDKASISIITCGPGNELYSTFGHSAFRVFDPLQRFDKIYNYGTFDFNAPNFYLNFAKGKLTYQLSTTPFSRFLREYQYENRWVKAQKLDLIPSDVQAVFNFLEKNAKPENKSYQYDFFYDNCSTKIESVLKTVLHDKINFNNDHIKTHKTHRDLIADYTKNQKWAKFGIDLALGSVIDKEASKDDYKFLPDYIFQSFEHATIKNSNEIKPLVQLEQSILKSNSPIIFSLSELFKPFNIILVISFFILLVTFNNYKSGERTKLLDILLFFSTGIIGIIVLLLWFATSHTATYKNFNFLWAFAPNIIVAFFMFKNKLPQWVAFYSKIITGLIVIMLIVWVSKIQIFNLALLPLLIAITARYLFLIFKSDSKTMKTDK